MTLVHKYITGRTAVHVASDIEKAISSGQLAPGDTLPPIRDLAGQLQVSPATVAAAYRVLQSRALLVSQGRRGSRVSHRPVAAARRRPAVPTGVVNCSDGNPDPALLPDPQRFLGAMKYRAHLYGQETVHTGLVALLRAEMTADGVAAGPCCVVNGTMDGLDRLFTEHLRPGDRIAIEDPGFTGHHDLAVSRGLSLAPVRVDEEGMLPDALERACRERVQAVLVTPRAQSPTGAALTDQRARDLRAVLRKHPDVLIIEDDHSSHIAGSAPFHRLHEPRSRWIHMRSLSKSFNPDLRVAVMTGDEQTVGRVVDRLVVVERWVSMLLQSLAHAMLKDSRVRAHVRNAARTYDERRNALIASLRGRGLNPVGRSGYNIWLPVQEETPVVQALASAGWAVAAGERFRLSSPAGVRITVSSLTPQQSSRLAASAARAVLGRSSVAEQTS